MKKLLIWIWDLLFPPKCVLCGSLLEKEETDLCHTCRIEAPVCAKSRKTLPFVAQWTVLWYYKDMVRESLLRFKFHNTQSYALAYGRFLAMKITQELPDFDILTWVPISPLRRLRRGYDQVKLLGEALGKELNVKPVRTLKNIRNTPPQSGIPDASRRRANVLGAYKAVNTTVFAGKRVLLLDDILTTGATAGECARVLLTAGASDVNLAVLAVASHSKEHK